MGAAVLVEVASVVEAGNFGVVWESPPELAAEQVKGSGPSHVCVSECYRAA